MTLNNREKLLLTILGIFLFLAVYIQFIFLPQWDSQSQLVKERDDLVQVLNDIDEYLNPQSTPRKEIRELEEDILTKTSAYFPEIDQEMIIIRLSEMITNAGMNPSAAKFSQISPAVVESVVVAPKLPEDYPFRDLARKYRGVITEGPAEISAPTPITLEKMEIGLQVQGTYAQIMALMNEMEAYSRRIHISQFDLSLSQTGELTGMMMIHIYGVPKVLDQDEDLAWSIFDLYGRDNPFSN